MVVVYQLLLWATSYGCGPPVIVVVYQLFLWATIYMAVTYQFRVMVVSYQLWLCATRS